MLQEGDESYEAYVDERDGILSSLARRAKVKPDERPMVVPARWKTDWNELSWDSTAAGRSVQQHGGSDVQ